MSHYWLETQINGRVHRDYGYPTKESADGAVKNLRSNGFNGVIQIKQQEEVKPTVDGYPIDKNNISDELQSAIYSQEVEYVLLNVTLKKVYGKNHPTMVPTSWGGPWEWPKTCPECGSKIAVKK